MAVGAGRVETDRTDGAGREADGHRIRLPAEPDEWRIYDKYSGRSLGGEPGETITDALRHIGYQLEES